MRLPSARPLGMFIWFGYALPVAERARLIREAGLAIENAHLTDAQANDLWLDNLAGEAALARYMADVEGLAACGIPVAVLHPGKGRTPPPVGAVGLARLRALAAWAQACGVRVAVENVRQGGRCAAILDAVDCPALGLCYDSGHDHVWGDASVDLLGRYGRRLFAVHLHDNLGDVDAHLPVGEGGVDWAAVRRGIAASAYQGSYTVEGDAAELTPGVGPQAHLRRHYLAVSRWAAGD